MGRPLLLGLLVLVAIGSSGCYYTHLARGQLALLWARRPIEEARTDPGLSGSTRRLLDLVGPIRRFARELGLRVGDQYTDYVDWPGDRIVTTIVRTREGTLEAVPFRFPFIGRLPYKGYFDRERAIREAERLRSRDFDVCLSGVAAYSTLGWLDDPVTAPMLQRGPATLVETILHELVHATAFVSDAADFNESVAQFIGQEAAVRFFRELEGTLEADRVVSPGVRSDWPSAQRVRDFVEDRRAVARLTVGLRERLIALEGEPDRDSWRERLEAETRSRMAELPLRVLEAERVSRAARLSDACLALRGTYVRDLPRHARVLDALGGDLAAMVERVSLWARESRPVEAFYTVDPPVDPAIDPAPVSSNEQPDRSATGQLDHALLDEPSKDL